MLPDPDPARTVVLYSAHSLPVKTVERQKDPYPRHIEETVRILDAALEGRYRSRLGYQSKVGPVEWLGPSTPEVLAELAKAGDTGPEDDDARHGAAFSTTSARPRMNSGWSLS